MLAASHCVENLVWEWGGTFAMWSKTPQHPRLRPQKLSSWSCNMCEILCTLVGAYHAQHVMESLTCWKKCFVYRSAQTVNSGHRAAPVAWNTLWMSHRHSDCVVLVRISGDCKHKIDDSPGFHSAAISVRLFYSKSSEFQRRKQL